MAYVYILRSKRNGRHYIGSTIDFDKRFQKHQKGLVKSTRNLRPFEIMRVQKYVTITEAKQIEYRIKKLKRKDYIESIIKDGDIKMRS